MPSSAIDRMNLGSIAGSIPLARVRGELRDLARAVAAAHRFHTLTQALGAAVGEVIEAALQDIGGGDAVDDFGAARRVMSAAIISRVTAAVERRSSQNATGRSRRANRLRANWRTDWVRGPSPPTRVSGRPTTRPPTLWRSINASSRAMSSRKRRRRMVSNGVAMMRRVSESARPIVLVPTSRPSSRRRPARPRAAPQGRLES